MTHREQADGSNYRDDDDRGGQKIADGSNYRERPQDPDDRDDPDEAEAEPQRSPD